MQLPVSCQNMNWDFVSVKLLPFCLKLCCFFFSLFWLQGRRGFPQASIIQRCNYVTFLWWSRKNQGRDCCSPGNWKSEALTFFFFLLPFGHIQYCTLTHKFPQYSLCSNTLCIVCKAGSACHPLRKAFIFCYVVRTLLVHYLAVSLCLSCMNCCQPLLLV